MTRKLITTTFLALWMGTGAVHAESVIGDALPSDDNLQRLEAQMQQQPKQLDLYFQYGQMATKLGEYEKAADAFEQMLQMDPSLDRVKLDLGVTYSKLGEFDKAKSLLREVLDRKIPDTVRNNVEQVLKQIEQASQTHYFSGTVGTGLHFDTNGNSASGNGQVTVQDTTFVLSSGDQATDDFQIYALAGLNHRYRMLEPLADGVHFAWKSGLSMYQSEQEHLDNLNLQLVNIKTGPSFVFDEINTSLDLAGEYTHIVLDQHSYLRLYTGSAEAMHALNERVKLTGKFSWEYRDYIDSPTVTTFDDRTGHAEQAKVGVSYAITQYDLVDVSAIIRHEDTKRTFYDNMQYKGTVGYTRLWGDDIFTRLETSYRNTNYDGPDPFVSASTTREDDEFAFSAMVGKTFNDQITATLGYTFRDVNSTLQNYEYDNHRLSSGVSVRF